MPNFLHKKESFHEVLIAGEPALSIQAGRPVLQAALDAGIPFYHDCGGKGKCTTCRVLVLEGEEWLNEPNRCERAAIKKMNFPPAVRLACQTTINGGNVSMQRIIRDKDDICFYVGADAGTETQEIGEERELVMFFLDIKEFTPFVESHLPFDVMHILRRLFNMFKTAIEYYKGSIIETEGDGFYAVFGLPKDVPVAGASQDAVNAALHILEQLTWHNKNYFFTHFNHNFEVGIGIHTGSVIAGKLGLGINNNRTVMGYAVNIAARLQAATRELNNSLVISDDVQQLLEVGPESKGTFIVDLKGIKEKMRVHLLGNSFAG